LSLREKSIVAEQVESTVAVRFQRGSCWLRVSWPSSESDMYFSSPSPMSAMSRLEKVPQEAAAEVRRRGRAAQNFMVGGGEWKVSGGCPDISSSTRSLGRSLASAVDVGEVMRSPWD
jgi:hypothetical protein